MIYTQRHRRLRGDMIQVIKIINVIDNINYEKFFKFTDYDDTINSHSIFIYSICSNTK